MTRSQPPALDVAALQDYLQQHVEGYSGDLLIEQFEAGQSNPTFKLSTPTRRYVLRRKPPGKLLASAHAVDREYRVITALAGTDVPVPKTWCLCNDAEIIGTPFYVMDYIEGRILWDPTLPTLDAIERRAMFDAMNRVIAALHTVNYVEIGLSDYGKPGNYLARQIDRWTRQYRASETHEISAFERLIDWLPANIPPGEETSIVHGDYRLDNLIFHRTEPRVIATLDWELSTLGHPLADFSYHCMMWRLPSSLRGLGREPSATSGIPTEPEYLAAYCERTGREGVEPEHWEFYMAYNLFRFGAILQGIMGRVKDGTSVSKQAETMGQKASTLAELGWRQVEKLTGRS